MEDEFLATDVAGSSETKIELYFETKKNPKALFHKAGCAFFKSMIYVSQIELFNEQSSQVIIN